MHFLADQDVYQVTIEWLRKEGHDVVTAKELRMQRAADLDLLKRAKGKDRLFLTRDKDFGALVFLRGLESAGVILLRVMPMVVREVHQQLRRLLREHGEEEMRKSFCVVEPHRYRIRQLP
jgi:predicted nuclease of predicted toxin-antitoxin system